MVTVIPCVDFDGENTMDSDYRRLTGITKEQFKGLVDSTQSVRSTSCRSERTAIGLFLTKLWNSLPHYVLANLFGLKRKNIFSRIVHAVGAILEDPVPDYLGF